jgi:hypothetical protein
MERTDQIVIEPRTTTATLEPRVENESARSVVLSAEHYTSLELGDLLQGGPSPHQLTRMRDQRSLLGVRVVRKGYMYPAFQFDVARRRLDPHVAKINQALLSRISAGDAAIWWLRSPDGRPTPAELLATEGLEPLLAMAREHLARVAP